MAPHSALTHDGKRWKWSGEVGTLWAELEFVRLFLLESRERGICFLYVTRAYAE